MWGSDPLVDRSTNNDAFKPKVSLADSKIVGLQHFKKVSSSLDITSKIMFFILKELNI